MAEVGLARCRPNVKLSLVDKRLLTSCIVLFVRLYLVRLNCAKLEILFEIQSSSDVDERNSDSTPLITTITLCGPWYAGMKYEKQYSNTKSNILSN